MNQAESRTPRHSHGALPECRISLDDGLEIVQVEGDVHGVLGRIPRKGESLDALLGTVVAAPIRQALAADRPQAFVFGHDDGQREVFVLPASEGGLLVLRDLTVVDRLTSTIASQTRLAALGTATVTAAHEINNTLTSIGNVIPLLEYEGMSPLERTKHLKNLKREADRATDIIGSLVNLARDWDDEVEAVDPVQVVKDVLALKRQILSDGGIRSEVGVSEEVISALTRRADLEAALLHLVTNAIEALSESPKGPKHLEVDVVRNNNRVEFFVRDSGSGVEDHMTDTLFERFQSTKPGRAGLGLWLAREAMQRNDGVVEYVGRENGRTVFRAAIPQILAQPMDFEVMAEFEEEPRFDQLQALMNLKILIVEDNQSLRTSVADILRLYGPSLVVEVANKAEAMDSIEQAKDLFDVVLLDVRLPDGSGIEVYEAMKDMAPHLQQQTAFLVGERIEGAIQRFLQKTGAPYVAKPFAVSKVIGAVIQIAQKAKKKKGKPSGVVQPRSSS